MQRFSPCRRHGLCQSGEAEEEGEEGEAGEEEEVKKEEEAKIYKLTTRVKGRRMATLSLFTVTEPKSFVFDFLVNRRRCRKTDAFSYRLAETCQVSFFHRLTGFFFRRRYSHYPASLKAFGPSKS